MLQSSGRRICVIEDDGIIAEDFSITLRECGFQVEALMAAEAMDRPEAWYESFDAAVVDFDTRSSSSVLERFTLGRVPIALLTGFEHEELPPMARRHLTIGKPIADGRLRDVALALILDRS